MNIGNPKLWRADAFAGAWDWFSRRAAIMPTSRRANQFSSFGNGTVICFPWSALYGEHAIRIGSDTLIGPYCSISAGMAPGQPIVTIRSLTSGDRCLIGRNSSIVGHFEITIGDDVFFGPNVYVTDQNHAIDNLDVPIGRQSVAEKPVSIGAGSWLGTNSVVLPGVTIGRHVAVGAGSVVTSDLPDYCVAVGSPARVTRQL